jgi:hypothetical protein
MIPRLQPRANANATHAKTITKPAITTNLLAKA